MARLVSLFTLLALLLHPATASTSSTAVVTQETRSLCETLRRLHPSRLVWDPLSPEGIATTTLPRARLYAAASLDYWNLESSVNRPACAFFPATTAHVADALAALADPAHSSVRFALKAGGHNANLGFSSVRHGLLISFRPNMRRVTILSDDDDDDDDGDDDDDARHHRGRVEIEAGCKWEDVYRVLGPLGRTVAGGRLGDVGVTGFILGGGLSYLSAQHGFGCDNVVDFETVLANGTVVHANATSHPELFFALCGGGNRFGVVTRFTMVTHALGGSASAVHGNSTVNAAATGLIWGGVRTYTADKHAAVLRAVSRFTSTAAADPRAAIIPTFNFAGALGARLPFILVTLFHDSPGGAPRGGVFADFDAIEAVTDDTRTRTFESLTAGEVLSGGRYMKGLRFRIAVNAFPAMPEEAMTAFLTDHWRLVRDRAANATSSGSSAAIGPQLDGRGAEALDFTVFSFAVQPVPRALVHASRLAHRRRRRRRRRQHLFSRQQQQQKILGSPDDAGDGDSDDSRGNALGLHPDHGDRVWIEYDVGWARPGCDARCGVWLEELRAAAHALHAERYAGIHPTNYRGGGGGDGDDDDDLGVISYRPLFMNDASETQDVLASYGPANRARLVAAQRAYDPRGLLVTRQGGHIFDG